MDMRCQPGPTRLTANIIEYLPLRDYLKRHTEETRSKSPIRSPSPRSQQRQDIYRTLVENNSKFDVEKVFARAPEFFKDKIGLQTRRSYYARKAEEPPASSSSLNKTKSTPSFYRQRIAASAPYSDFKASKGGTHYYKNLGTGDSEAVHQTTPISSSKPPATAPAPVSVTTSSPSTNSNTKTPRSSKFKHKPEWKHVGKSSCRDSFSSVNDYYAPSPVQLRNEALQVRVY